MIEHNANLETHPDGIGDLNAILNGNWANLAAMFSPTVGMTASQGGVAVTSSAALFTADDEGATIRFDDGTERVIGGITSPTEVEVTVSGTVVSQGFRLYRPGESQRDALMRGLTKRVRMLSTDDKQLFYWDQTLKQFVLAGVAVTADGLDIAGDRVRIRTQRTISTITDAGNEGEICWDADYLYVCIATNSWRRLALTSW